jgi:hypothetical protein
MVILFGTVKIGDNGSFPGDDEKLGIKTSFLVRRFTG